MGLTVRKLSQNFVAELRGVDLRNLPNQQILDEIYDAFLTYRIVVIPGQALSIDQQLAFAELFGPLHVLPDRAGSKRRIGNRAIDDVSNLDADGELAGANSERAMFAMGNQLWHSDLSFCENPAHASMLHATEIATEGGETEFCDLVSAFESLAEDMQKRLMPLIAEHSLAHSRVSGGYSKANIEALLKLRPPALQPVVRTHPETGKCILFVGAHVSRILSMADNEAQALVEELIEHATRPENVYQHRWAVNDLLIWDNRQVLHRGRPYDVDNVRRVMHRITVDGDGPTIQNGKIVTPEIRRRNVCAPA